jgi:hypothetical protein
MTVLAQKALYSLISKMSLDFLLYRKMNVLAQKEGQQQAVQALWQFF